ncbi:MAG: histidine kinase [Bacteroidales bacterium]|nr:histidine kinase [Bacteroidales bacterium]
MVHPVFIDKKSVSVYFGLWILIMGVHFSIYYFAYLFPIEISLADSLVFNSIFCGIGITLWYVARYSTPDQKNIGNVILNHLAFLTISLVVWTGASYTILSVLFQDDKNYLTFLLNSIPNRIFSGSVFYVLLALAYYFYIYYQNFQEKIKSESRLRELLKETELNMLKSQINPHFLFNSLNSISSLTITNPEKAREMVIKLSDFLRYSVSSNINQFTTFSNEIANIKRYLEIEKVRFGDKLQFSFNLDERCQNYKIPPMLLQPLFENAIKHGVYESTEQVNITMDCNSDDCCMEIKIRNDFDPNAHARKGTGLGLNNIRERLRLLYHAKQLLKTSVEGNKFFVYLTLPNIDKPEKKSIQ